MSLEYPPTSFVSGGGGGYLLSQLSLTKPTYFVFLIGISVNTVILTNINTPFLYSCNNSELLFLSSNKQKIFV